MRSGTKGAMILLLVAAYADDHHEPRFVSDWQDCVFCIFGKRPEAVGVLYYHDPYQRDLVP